MAYYVGMMSGTSLDGIDAVLAKVTHGQWQVIHHVDIPIPSALKAQLLQLNQPQGTYQGGELHATLVAEQQLTHCYANAYQQLIHQANCDNGHLIAIGAHGQTIRHCPNDKIPYTVQLLNGPLLAQLTKKTVVCDFRRADIAAGGQGAPLAPLFHQVLFACQPPFAVINIGGISNISLITRDETRGFDCGPGNCLLDEWTQQNIKQPFDYNGNWGKSGRLIPTLLAQLLSDPYFSLSPPKSTGRDYFNLQWLKPYLNGDELGEDVMRTLVTLTAKTIANAIPSVVDTAIIVGGGAKNSLLMQAIQTEAPQTRITSSDALNLAPQQVEALGFALLCQQTIERKTVDTRAITGAQHPIILGAVHYFG